VFTIFDPDTQFTGSEKITLCNTKDYRHEAGMNLTPPASQTCHVARWNCTAESKWRVAEIKSEFLSHRPTDQKACDRHVAVRRVAVVEPLLPGAGRAAIGSISPARRAHSSKSAARCWSGR